MLNYGAGWNWDSLFSLVDFWWGLSDGGSWGEVNGWAGFGGHGGSGV